MKLVRWKRFTWDLTQLPAPESVPVHPYTVRPAFADDCEAVSKIILSAFTLDPAWSDTFANIREWLASQITAAFDRESAAECHAELMALPRVASGRCKVAAIGMRLDARTRSAETLALWARAIKLPFLAALREAQVYVRGVERGVTLFDLPADKVAADLAQWQPLLEWLEPALAAVHKPAIRGNPSVLRSAPMSLDGRSAPMGLDSRAAPLPRLRAQASVEPRRRSTAERLAGWLGWLTTPKVRRPSAS